MRAAHFIARAQLLQDGRLIDQGSLIGVLLKLDQVAPNERDGFTVHSGMIGTVSAQRAAELLRTYRAMLHSD